MKIGLIIKPFCPPIEQYLSDARECLSAGFFDSIWLIPWADSKQSLSITHRACMAYHMIKKDPKILLHVEFPEEKDLFKLLVKVLTNNPEKKFTLIANSSEVFEGDVTKLVKIIRVGDLDIAEDEAYNLLKSGSDCSGIISPEVLNYAIEQGLVE